MKLYFPLFLAITLLYACKNDDKLKREHAIISTLSNGKDQIVKLDSIRPIWGYRFQLIGNFEGKGIQDTFMERYYSDRDHRETNKFYTGIDDVWQMYDSAHQKLVNAFFLCSNPRLDTLPASGVFGPLSLRNEGDLDGDGGDEVSFVPTVEQQSSLTHCYILSFKHGKWKEIYSFGTWEWKFPPLPDGGKHYGPWGTDGMYAVDKNDTINQLLEKQLKDFPGLITKLKSGKVAIQTQSSIFDDTTIIVDLRKHPKPFN